MLIDKRQENMADINRISVTRKGIFDECQQKYKYRYILKIDPPQEEPFYFVYGKIIHKIAEEYVRNKGKKHLNEIKDMVLEGKIELEHGQVAPPLPIEYAKRVAPMLRAVSYLTEQIGFEGELEYDFAVDLDPPNGILYQGIVDWLIPKNGGIYIIDYKTTKKGRWRKTPRTIQNDLQLRAYAWAIQQKFDIPAEKIKGALFYLEGSNLIATRFTQKAMDSARQELLDAFHKIRATDPDKILGTVGDHCGRCEYQTLCPFLRMTG
jgi:CRISPR/Cas system-associated exonuclease Cas4 (RecB family)